MSSYTKVSTLPVLRVGTTYRVRSVVGSNPCAIEEESNCAWIFTLTLAECLHELVETSRSLDLEEDFIVAIGDLDVEVLATSRRLRLRAVRGLLVIRHCEGVEESGCKSTSFGSQYVSFLEPDEGYGRREIVSSARLESTYAAEDCAVEEMAYLVLIGHLRCSSDLDSL